MKKAPPNEAVAQYIERLESLYTKVADEWLPAIDPDASATRGHRLLDEELSGPYEAPALSLCLTNGNTIHLVPRGCYVIAAAGRLDFESKLGRESIVYLEGVPTISTETRFRDQVVSAFEKKFGSDHEPGWAWVQNKSTGDFPVLTRDEFERLIETLSE